MLNETTKVTEAVLKGFHKCRVLVVGDLMLDRYLWGEVEKISPEAPVPVVRLDHKTHAAGGAANVAVNLGALGCKASVAGVLGADEDGEHLLKILRTFGLETSGIVSTPERPTTCSRGNAASKPQKTSLPAFPHSPRAERPHLPHPGRLPRENSPKIANLHMDSDDSPYVSC